MRKIRITAPDAIAGKLEDNLRHRFDIETEIIPDYNNPICEIKAKIKREWVTVCRFLSDETFKDILTMFEVNYELKTRQN